MNADSFRYDGKRALVVGGATGIGGATAQLVRDLGAAVVVMDRAKVEFDGVESIHLDLSDRASIDTALDECGGPIDALFSCAGVADGTPGIERINFIGHRHLIDEALAKGYLGRGAAIGMVSSAAGLGWQSNLEQLNEYLATEGFEGACEWIAAHPHRADYLWSKLSVCAYVAHQALPMLQKGVRINAVLPGPTNTPLARANAEMWLGFGTDYREAAGIEASRPEEQAGPLAFLCSAAASYVNGITLVADAGYVSAGVTGVFAPATAAVEFLMSTF